ncbi:hypothetical protein [uncultured Clostridium sp.]|uniref:hypothetical protein n=1 Tax=uncultured Clostridium sp. TaxID=59620 RepID=UPI0027DBE2EF|nr:hypothetical protein [uncultured Clostridium sp.]
MRKVYISILLIGLLLSNFYISPVYAEGKYNTVKVAYSTMVVQATVPDNFDRTVYINFTAEDGTNREYTLTKSNDYVLEDKIKCGSNNINFITIGNNQDDKYGYSLYNSNTILNAEKGKPVIFAINIIENEDDQQQVQEEKTVEPVIKSDEVKEDISNEVNQKKDIVDIDKSIDSKKENDGVTKLFMSIFINVLGFTLIGAVLFIYLYLKKKKEENE